MLVETILLHSAYWAIACLFTACSLYLSSIHLDGVHTEQGPRPAPRVSFQREMAADAL